MRGLQNKFDYYSKSGYNNLVGYDKGLMMASKFTVVILTEMNEYFTFKDMKVSEITTLLERFLDETVIETKITLQE